MSKGNKFDINFKFDRSTKGAHRLNEVDDEGKVVKISDGATIGTLYLRKDKVGDKEPSEVKMTIEVIR